jgi:hypothetical protein
MAEYRFEGPVWGSDVVTWSFAQNNYPADAADPFSASVSGPYQATVLAALQRWQGVSGVTFDQVADSPNTDIRIGFGDLPSSNEIGETDFLHTADSINVSKTAPDGTLFQPDVLVRLEDPSIDPLTAGAGGVLTYAGTETTLYQVALHEIGHSLGMAHATDPDAVMYPTVGPSNPDLDATDIAGIDVLYPPPAPPPPSPVFVGGNVFTDGGQSAAITTGSGSNVIIGTVGNDTITTGAGSTNLIGPGSGNDLIVSGGADTIFPGGGSDTVFAVGHVLAAVGAGTLFFINGGQSSTVIGGGAGRAVIDGGSGGGLFAAGAGGGSVIFAGAGTATVFGVAGGDVLFAGGSAPDLLLAGAGNETLSGLGSSGANQLHGGSGADLIGGGAGTESFFAGTGNDTFIGGSGADLYVFSNGSAGGQDLIEGFNQGKGDQVSLQGYGATAAAAAVAGQTASAAGTTLTLADNSTITFAGVGHLSGSAFA